MKTLRLKHFLAGMKHLNQEIYPPYMHAYTCVYMYEPCTLLCVWKCEPCTFLFLWVTYHAKTSQFCIRRVPNTRISIFICINRHKWGTENAELAMFCMLLWHAPRYIPWNSVAVGELQQFIFPWMPRGRDDHVHMGGCHHTQQCACIACISLVRSVCLKLTLHACLGLLLLDPRQGHTACTTNNSAYKKARTVPVDFASHLQSSGAPLRKRGHLD